VLGQSGGVRAFWNNKSMRFLLLSVSPIWSITSSVKLAQYINHVYYYSRMAPVDYVDAASWIITGVECIYLLYTQIFK